MKRATARAAKTHASYFPCEYCLSKGQLLNDQDPALKTKKTDLQKQKQIILQDLTHANENNDEENVRALTSLLEIVNNSIKFLNQKNNKIVWPASSSNGEPRTLLNVSEISNKIENSEILSIDEAKGIVGRSLFLDIPYFNIVIDIPTEYLHSVCLGTVKRTVELTFNVGDNRQRITKRKLSNVSDFNKLVIHVKFPRESSRRARSLDFSVMKGQEFRNIAIFMFVIVINCIEEEAKERRLWLLLAYMIRACVLPSNEYNVIDPSVILYCEKHFYTLYEQLFGAQNCSYNTHVVGSHIPNMRAHGPLTFTSAFAFESFYGELRNSFTPGTKSPLKQILQKVIMKRTLESHCCESSIYYSPQDSALECNSQIYTFHDEQFFFFKIMSIEDDSFHCLKIGKYETSFPETPTLNWAKVGVFKAGGVSDEIVTIMKNNIAGKVIKVMDYFITCPNNVLQEK